ncbi:MAG: hypothetical protein GX287_07040 [Fusobacteria bacterium]|nr:hypothetical protein [Fusobacteriota bacterium]
MKNIKKFLLLTTLIVALFASCQSDNKDEFNSVYVNKDKKLVAKEAILGVEFEIKGEYENIDINSDYLYISNVNNGNTTVAIAKKGEDINIGDVILDLSFATNAEIVLKDVITESKMEKAVLNSGKFKRAGETLLGDFNNDEKIDIFDFNIFKENYNKTGTNICDIAPATKGTGNWASLYAFSTPDAIVNASDLAVLANNYGKTKPEAVLLQGITVTGSSTAFVGDTINITVNASYSNGTSNAITSEATFVSSDPSVVAVEAGALKAKAKGSAIITATYDGKTASHSITVNEKGSSGSGGEAYNVEGYATNPNGQVGQNKTITGFSDWSESMKIAQGIAADTPRNWLGYHEYPDPDLYALFAAWDSTNLYLMVEIPHIDEVDTIDNDKSYAGSQFLPMGWALNTGKRATGNGLMADGCNVWTKGKFFTFEDGVDTIIMHHPRLNIGTPGFFITDSNGYFGYEEDICLSFKETGVVRDIYFQQSVSANIWAAVGSDGNFGGKTSSDMSTYTLKDIKSGGTKMTAYQITVPLASLNIDKSYIETTGISVAVFSTYGESTMDVLPWDPSMIDNATTEYSADSSTSAEKEDYDKITVPLARVGK